MGKNEWEIRNIYFEHELSYGTLTQHIKDKLSDLTFEKDVTREDVYIDLHQPEIGLKIRNFNGSLGDLECKIRNKPTSANKKEHWVKFEFGQKVKLFDFDTIIEIIENYSPPNRKKTWNNHKESMLNSIKNNSKKAFVCIKKDRETAKGKSLNDPFGKIEISRFEVNEIEKGNNKKQLGEFTSLNVTGKKSHNIENIIAEFAPKDKRIFKTEGFPEFVSDVISNK